MYDSIYIDCVLTEVIEVCEIVIMFGESLVLIIGACKVVIRPIIVKILSVAIEVNANVSMHDL